MKRAFGYAWRVLVNLLHIAVVAAVFGHLHERELTIIVSILGLIYVTMRSTAIAQAMALGPTMLGITRMLTAIQAEVARRELDTSAIEEAEQAISHSIMKAGINGVGLTIISLICLFQLLTAL